MKQKLLHRKSLKKIIVVALIIGLAVYFVIWAASPSKGSVDVSATSKNGSTTSVPTIKNLDGTYIAFSYSGKYLAKSEGSKNNELEIHTLSADTHYDKRIIASVSNLPDGQIGSYGAYIYRKLHTETYTVKKVQVAGEAADLWVKNDGSEQTVMIPRGNKVATITFTTASMSDKLDSEAEALLKSFRWKQ